MSGRAKFLFYGGWAAGVVALLAYGLGEDPPPAAVAEAGPIAPTVMGRLAHEADVTDPASLTYALTQIVHGTSQHAPGDPADRAPAAVAAEPEIEAREVALPESEAEPPDPAAPAEVNSRTRVQPPAGSSESPIENAPPNSAESGS